MATSKALRTKSSGARRKQNQLVRVGGSMVSNANFLGVAKAVPHNPRLRRMMTKTATDETFKLIVIKVDPDLNKPANDPLNPKALQAKAMFANYRKNH